MHYKTLSVKRGRAGRDENSFPNCFGSKASAGQWQMGMRLKVDDKLLKKARALHKASLAEARVNRRLAAVEKGVRSGRFTAKIGKAVKRVAKLRKKRIRREV